MGLINFSLSYKLGCPVLLPHLVLYPQSNANESIIPSGMNRIHLISSSLLSSILMS